MTSTELTSIAPPEPDLTPAEMLRRAIELRPVLRERQAECEALGRLPDSTNADFIKAGFYRILQPRRFGGYEFDVRTFVDVMAEVARGCPSSGWVLALTSGHTHTLTYLGEQAQVEAYGTDGDYRAPFVATPGVFAVMRDAGCVLDGGWDYASGCDIATHFLGHVAVASGDAARPFDILIALIDRSDFAIVDNWDVVGMRGTGSRRAVVRDLYLPEHRFVRSPLMDPSAALPSGHANPLYRGRLLSLLMMEIAAVSVGIALAAIDAYEDILRTKRVSTPISPLRFEDTTFQQHFGHAWALVSTAQAALRQVAADYLSFAARQAAGAGEFSDEEDRRLLLIEQQIVRLAGEVVDLLFRTGGSSAGKAAAPLQRYMRDMSFVRTHMGPQFEGMQQNYAKVRFGLRVEGSV
jgi:3-hydroxy-9,10-secoandrosta-1,3,5(10)-triene-9,17-dione monooxygenase